MNTIDKELADAAELPPVVHVDWFLQQLVGIVNSSNISVGITLCVDGGVISGQLISVQKYYAKFGELFASGFPSGGEELREVYAKYGENLSPDQMKNQPPPQFINLEDAHYVTPSGQTPTSNSGGLLWRGRIAAVSGWSLGALRTSENQ